LGRKMRARRSIVFGCVALGLVAWGFTAVAQRYSWIYEGRPWEMTVTLSASMLEAFRGLPRGTDYSAYVGHPDNGAALREVVDGLRRLAASAGYSAEKTAGLAMALVQSLPYVPDGGPGRPMEYPNFPLETLASGGDCEDKAILAGALMKGLGLSVGLLHFSSTMPAHMAVGIALPPSVAGTYYPHGGQRYYYGETTEPGWSIGQIPPSYRGSMAYIEPL
jgi:hypothetical protein